jgi:hypothetical protein
MCSLLKCFNIFSGERLSIANTANIISPESRKRRAKQLTLSIENKDAQKEKDKSRKKRSQDNKSTDEHAMQSKKNKEHMRIFHQNESPDASTAKMEKDNLNKKRIRDDESPDTSAVRKIKDKTPKKRKRQSCQQDAVNVHDDKEMKRSVERAIKEAKHILHRTQNHQAPHSARYYLYLWREPGNVGLTTCRRESARMQTHTSSTM